MHAVPHMTLDYRPKHCSKRTLTSESEFMLQANTNLKAEVIHGAPLSLPLHRAVRLLTHSQRCARQLVPVHEHSQSQTPSEALSPETRMIPCLFAPVRKSALRRRRRSPHKLQLLRCLPYILDKPETVFRGLL